MKIGFKATQIAVAGFVVPFMAVYDPALMLQGDITFLSVCYIVFKAVLAILLWGCAAVGYLWMPLSMPERVVATVGAFLLVVALPVTDEIGFALGVVFVGWQWFRHRKG